MAAGEGSSEPDDEAYDVPRTLEPQQIEDSWPSTPQPKSELEVPPRESPDDNDASARGDKHLSSDEDKEDDQEDEDEDEDEDEEEDEEPRLKYAPLTKNLGSVYRNGDATSAFLVAGDKLIMGTHNGQVYVYSMPMLQDIKRYSAHRASVSCVSISPYPPPLPFPTKLDAPQRSAPRESETRQSQSSGSPSAKNTPRQASVPKNPSNDIYIATSSIDGHVCIQSLVDPKDVQLRNFARPVQAVALSPEFKSDKTYLSGGQAESLILTVGGVIGKTTNATVSGASTTTSSWLGTIGLGSSTGTDKVLHTGEGTISTIKWSLSGKYVLWVNEKGIKIARSHLKLDNSETGLEWKRISHTSPRDRHGWEEIVAVQKARAQWIDRSSLDSDQDPALRRPPSNGAVSDTDKADFEEAVVGWGDTVWILRVTPGDGGSIVKQAAPAGRVEITAVIRFDDCMIAGVSLYTPTLLLILAYMERKGSSSKKATNSTPRSRSKRHNALKPELRLIDINTKEEIETDSLPVSRFESLASSDYHLGVLYPMKIPAQLAQKGYLSQVGSGMVAVGSGLVTGTEVVAQGMWDATMYGPRMLGANRLFNQAETGSTRSGRAGTDKSLITNQTTSYLTNLIPGLGSSIFNSGNEDLKAVATTQGMKIFLMSPFDCIVAVRRTLADRVQWLEKIQRYQRAWELLDEHPEAAGSASSASGSSSPPTPSKASSVGQSTIDSVTTPSKQAPKPTLAEFFADSASVLGSPNPDIPDKYSNAEKEKRRLGELWLQQEIDGGNWSGAGAIAGKVLNTTSRWEHWTWVFIRNKKFDEITPHLPAMELTPPLSASVFEVILGHYVFYDRKRFQELIDTWPTDLFDIGSITSAIREQLSNKEVAQYTHNWRILTECLAKLRLADGHYKEALHCYIQLQDADAALSLIKDHHLVEAVADDISGFVTIRITSQQRKSASQTELEALSIEPIKLIVDEASRGTVDPDDVVESLNSKDFRLFLFFYFKYLWQGTGQTVTQATTRQRHRFSTAKLAADEGRLLVDHYPDLAVDLFSLYDREIFMDYLQASTLYDFQYALKICEKKKFIEEEVYLLSKTGGLKKALYLIIEQLQDVSKAIAFAKSQDDKGLWDDLLDYSMSRPRFISGLLSDVGTAIDPIVLVKRIPSGIEVEGLKDGLKKMLREYDLQDSISSGAARILSSEVAVTMDILRRGRRKGIKFDVPKSSSTSTKVPGAFDVETNQDNQDTRQAGHCASCNSAFLGEDSEMLVGFACGHVYHIDCLSGKTTIPQTVDPEEEDDGMNFSRSIATKVTNARLLRDRISFVGGCKICKARREQIDAVVHSEIPPSSRKVDHLYGLEYAEFSSRQTTWNPNPSQSYDTLANWSLAGLLQLTNGTHIGLFAFYRNISTPVKKNPCVDDIGTVHNHKYE